MTSGNFRVRFWGVRGSIASPGPDTVRYGGNTPCIEVLCGGRRIVFDAGTGIRPLGRELALDGPIDLDLFLTHTHFDHVSGLPFFQPAFDPRNVLRIWAGHLGPERGIEEVLSGLMSEPLFPVPLSVFRRSCRFRDFACGDVLEPSPGVRIGTAALNHPGGACGYRVEFAGRSVAIVTDTEHRIGERDAGVVAFVRGADLLIYDGMYDDRELPERVGWGHSTWQEGIRVAQAAGVGRLAIFHHEPARTDEELDRIAAEAEPLRPGTIVAREGLVLTL